MEITGEQRLPMPPDRLWGALTNARSLQAALPGCTGVDEVESGRFQGRFSNGTTARWRLSRGTSPSVLEGGYEVDGAGAGQVTGTLAQEGGFTALRYAIRPDGEGPADTAPTQRFLNRLFTGLAAEASGPSAVAAEGIAAAVAAPRTPNGGGMAAALARLPAEPLGLPRVAWIGVPLFLLIAILLLFG